MPRETEKKMLMEHFEGTTKSIMVFSKTPIERKVTLITADFCLF